MTYTPPTISELKKYLVGQNATISIARFCEPTSTRQFRGYHLSKSQIMQGDPGAGCKPMGTADYSIQTARDKAGLSEARAAIDIQFPKAKLQRYSKWLLAQAQSNAPGTKDWRELIYSPDGVTVLRWDRERGVDSAPRAGEADQSHTYHTHVSFYRDSESREKVTAFAGFFTPPPPVDPPDVPTTDELQAQLDAANAALQAAEDALAKDEAADSALDAAVATWQASR